MRKKPVIPRQQANRDIDEILASYLSADSATATLGLIDTLVMRNATLPPGFRKAITHPEGRWTDELACENGFIRLPSLAENTAGNSRKTIRATIARKHGQQPE